MNLLAMIQLYVTYHNTNMRMATGPEGRLPANLRPEKKTILFIPFL